MRYLLKIMQIIICHFCNHTWVTNRRNQLDKFSNTTTSYLIYSDRIRVCNKCHKRESSSFSKDIEGSWGLKWDNDPIQHDPWVRKNKKEKSNDSATY